MELNSYEYTGAMSTGLMDLCDDNHFLEESWENYLIDNLNLATIVNELDKCRK